MPTKDSTRWKPAGKNSAGDPMYERHLSRPSSEKVSAASSESDYGSMTKDELSDELEKRGLAKSGNKDELVERLQDDDSK